MPTNPFLFPSLPMSRMGDLPNACGVYVVRSSLGWIYVGQSVCIRQRLFEHGDRFAKYGDCSVYYAICSNLEAVRLELQLKLELQPLANKQITQLENTYTLPVVRRKKSSGVVSKLPQLLKDRNLSLTAVAARSGLSHQTIGKIYRNHFDRLDVATIESLCRCLGLRSINELLEVDLD